ncbi:PREDICTED: uncharacterized protein LOC109160698 isoform X2 [Ipomoea nil]|uniref:uncharacterized protein LOC109160698 isoform X2 n=1 Tax=Ipomoea nil TaxID=35883 RepID=UPI0009008A7C|nr:PREDICTED: uncharacterized protein LOC109160698 isoform X2 [Ipomoea nil]
MTCIPMYKSPEFSVGGPRGEVIVENDGGRSSSSSSSSIGRNSDESAAGGDADGEGLEVQGSAIHLEDLEEALRLKEESWSLSLRVLLQYSDSCLDCASTRFYNGRDTQAIETGKDRKWWQWLRTGLWILSIRSFKVLSTKSIFCHGCCLS